MSRGIRNNNPGNIDRNSTQWLGMAPEQTDDRFIVFSEMKYGCRALLKLLSNYINKYKCDTVEKIISRYAPSNENCTSAYIQFVMNKLGVLGNTKLKADKATLIKLSKAIADYENGKDARVITEDDWEEAYKLL